LKKKTIVRNQKDTEEVETKGTIEQNMEYLDIPAFLRRQGD